MLRLVALYNAMEPRPGPDGTALAASREALLARIAAVAGAQRRLLSQDPAPELRALGTAHQALRRAVNDPATPAAPLAVEFSRLADRLRRAADIAAAAAPG